MIRLLAALSAVVFVAGAQTPRFAYVGAPVPPDFRVFAALDVDTDGDVDLLAREGLLTNDGNGRFAPVATAPSLLSALFYTKRVLTPDLDGDGDADLLAIVPTGGVTSTPFAFLAGPGGLVDLPLALPMIAARYEALDYDGDGLDDLCVGAPSFILPAPFVAILRNAGGGVFTTAPAGTVPSGGAPSGGYADFAAADLDADGDRDVALFDPVSGAGAVWLDTGATFAATTFALPANSGNFVASAVADLDQDGRDDVVWSIDSYLPPRLRGTIRLPAGGGPICAWTTVASRINRFLALDADGDGATDLCETSADGPFMTASRSHVRFGPFAAAVPASSSAAEEGVEHLAAFDADGDGDRDLLYCRGSLTCGLRFVGANGGFVDAGGVAVIAGFNSGNGAAPVVPVIGDFDGDGDPDVVAPPGLGSAAPTVALNDGRGGMTTTSPPPSAANFVAAAAGDFDGDGRADLVAAPPALGGATVKHFRSLPSGGFATTNVMTVSGAPTAAAALDFDADGDLDVALALVSPPRISKFVNVGGSFVFGGDVALPALANELRVADLDGDGRPDLLAPNGSTVPFVDGASLSVATPLLSGSGQPIAADRVNAADFDGDGDLDLLADADVRLNVGSLLFAYQTTLSGYPQAVAGPFLPHELLDANGDGAADVVSFGALWYGGAGASFSAPEAIPFPAFAVAQTFPMVSYRPVDLDRDGDPDLIDPAGRALFNVTAQAAAGAPAAPGRTASIMLRGPPNGVADLFVAPYVFAQPVPIVGIGNLFLTPGSAAYLGQFPLDGTGAFELPLAVPNVPSLVGLSLYWQAFLPTPRRLTNALRTPVLPL
jgi:hypothetical protein